MEPQRFHTGTHCRLFEGNHGRRLDPPRQHLGIDYATMTMPDTVKAQAEGAFWNVRLALAHFGAGLNHVVRARIFVPDPTEMDRVHPIIWREFAEILPVNTTVCCPLPSPEVLFEIEVRPIGRVPEPAPASPVMSRRDRASRPRR